MKAFLDPEELMNYRPVSNLAYSSKLIEKAVVTQYTEHCVCNNISNPTQSDFKNITLRKQHPRGSRMTSCTLLTHKELQSWISQHHLIPSTTSCCWEPYRKKPGLKVLHFSGSPPTCLTELSVSKSRESTHRAVNSSTTFLKGLCLGRCAIQHLHQAPYQGDCCMGCFSTTLHWWHTTLCGIESKIVSIKIWENNRITGLHMQHQDVDGHTFPKAEWRQNRDHSLHHSITHNASQDPINYHMWMWCRDH